MNSNYLSKRKALVYLSLASYFMSYQSFSASPESTPSNMQLATIDGYYQLSPVDEHGEEVENHEKCDQNLTINRGLDTRTNLREFRAIAWRTRFNDIRTTILQSKNEANSSDFGDFPFAGGYLNKKTNVRESGAETTTHGAGLVMFIPVFQFDGFSYEMSKIDANFMRYKNSRQVGFFEPAIKCTYRKNDSTLIFPTSSDLRNVAKESLGGKRNKVLNPNILPTGQVSVRISAYKLGPSPYWNIMNELWKTFWVNEFEMREGSQDIKRFHENFVEIPDSSSDMSIQYFSTQYKLGLGRQYPGTLIGNSKNEVPIYSPDKVFCINNFSVQNEHENDPEKRVFSYLISVVHSGNLIYQLAVPRNRKDLNMCFDDKGFNLIASMYSWAWVR